jgi:hypothetical protein
MFLLNSRHPLVTATPKRLPVLPVYRSGHTFFRSYGVNLPSSFWMVLSHALGYSPHPLVSVSVRSPAHPVRGFSWKHGISHLRSTPEGVY